MSTAGASPPGQLDSGPWSTQHPGAANTAAFLPDVQAGAYLSTSAVEQQFGISTFKGYVIRRLALSVVTVLVASFLVFLLQRLTPGTIVDAMVGQYMGMNPDEAAAEDSMYGGTAALYFWGQDVPSADTNLNQWVTRMYISPVMQRLVEADFVQYGPRGTGEFTNFTSDNISPQYSRGALAESWEVTADRMVFQIRDGIMWAADGKEHVMESRPYTAEDCAFALNRIADRGNAGWRTENGGFIDSIHAEGGACIVETSTFNPGGFANIAQHAGSVHYPREVIEAGPGSWDNLVGTGPFLVKEAVVGSHIVFARNPQYWRTTTIDGTEYALPFIDEMIMPNLPDETTQIASLRTGKLDIMGTVSVKYRETLADTSPDLQSHCRARAGWRSGRLWWR